MSKQHKSAEKIRLVVHVKKIYLHLRFHCKVSFLLKNQYNENVAQSVNAYELISGESAPNEAVYCELDSSFFQKSFGKSSAHSKLKLVIMMVSANGMVPAGSLTIDLLNKKINERVEESRRLEKCEDSNSKVKFVYLLQNIQQTPINKSYAFKEVLPNKQSGQKSSSHFRNESQFDNQHNSYVRNGSTVRSRLFDSNYNRNRMRGHMMYDNSQSYSLSPSNHLALRFPANQHSKSRERRNLNQQKTYRQRYNHNVRQSMVFEDNEMLYQEDTAIKNLNDDQESKSYEYFTQIVQLQSEVEEAKSKIDSLQEQLQIEKINTAELIERHKNEVQSLYEKYEDQLDQSVKVEAEKARSVSSKKIETLEEQFESEKTNLIKERQNNAELLSKISTLVNEAEKKDVQIKQLKAVMSQNEQTSKMNTNNLKLALEIEYQNVDKLTTETEELKEKINTLQNHLHIKSQQCQEAQRRIEINEAQNSEKLKKLQTDYDSLAKENTGLKSEIEKHINFGQMMAAKLKELQSQKDEFNQKFITEGQLRASKERQIENLNLSTLQLKSKMSSEVEEKQLALDALKEEFAFVKQLYSKEQEEKSQLQKVKSEMETTIRGLQSQKEKIEHELQEIKKQTSRKLRQADQKYDDLVNEMVFKDKQIENLSVQRTKNQENNKALETKINQLTEQLQRKGKLIDQFAAQYRGKLSETQSLNFKISELQRENQQCKLTNHELISSLKSQYEVLFEQNKGLQSAYSNLMEENSFLQSSIQQKVEKQRALQQEVNQLEKVLEEQRVQNQSMKTEAQTKLKSKEQELQSLCKKLEQAEQSLTLSQEAVSGLQTELNVSQIQHENSLAELTRSHQNSIQELTEKYKQLEQGIPTKTLSVEEEQKLKREFKKIVMENIGLKRELSNLSSASKNDMGSIGEIEQQVDKDPSSPRKLEKSQSTREIFGKSGMPKK